METTIYPNESRMFNPPHPGATLKEMYLKPTKTTITDFAQKLGVDRKTVSRIVNGRCGITAEMALRIGKLLQSPPDMWLSMQADHDLWHAQRTYKKELKGIKPLHMPEVAHI